MGLKLFGSQIQDNKLPINQQLLCSIVDEDNRGRGTYHQNLSEENSRKWNMLSFDDFFIFTINFKKDWSEVINSVCKQSSIKDTFKHKQCKCRAISNENEYCECVGFSEQNYPNPALIEYLDIEVQQLSLKYQQILKQNERTKKQCLILSSLSNENIKKLAQFEQHNHILHEKNKEMTHQLKQTKDRAKKQSEQFTMKLQAIELENKKLCEFRKYAVQNENQLNQIISDNELEIKKISEEIFNLKYIFHHYQMKFQQLVENEVRIKSMDDSKLRKLEQKYALSEIPTQNTLDSAQSRNFKEPLEKLRIFKLQEFQQKLQTLHSINHNFKQTIKNDHFIHLGHFY